MEVYVRAELPETCYIHEAALWLALGIVPRFFPDSNGHDVRKNVDEHLENFEAVITADFFEMMPVISKIFPGIDEEMFTDALSTTAGRPLEDIQQALAEQKEALRRMNEEPESVRGGEHIIAIVASIASELEEELAKARWLLPYITEMQRMAEIAQAQLFCALADGQLQARGILASVRLNEDPNAQNDEYIGGEISPILPQGWRLSWVNWDKAGLALPGNEFGWIGVQILTSDLFRLFPKPRLPSISLTSSLVGAALIVNSEEDQPITHSTAKRGRSPIGGGLIGPAVEREFLRRHSNGRLPEKAEATTYEAIQWVKEIFNVDVGRSTAQRYLAMVFAAQKSRP